MNGNFWLAFSDRPPKVTGADLFLPLLVGTMLLIPFMGMGLDMRLTAQFFDLEKGGFFLSNHWALKTLLHDWMKHAVRVAAMPISVMALASLLVHELKPMRRMLWFLVLGMSLSSATVSMVKHASTQACPAGLSMFGGSLPHVGLFDQVPSGLRPGRCWPGGHASFAFSFFPLYFAARHAGHARLARTILLAVIGFGLVLTMVQVARGEHFFSHQVWTALICWYVTLTLYWGAFQTRQAGVKAIPG